MNKTDWIPHFGGHCPVQPNMLVLARYRYETEEEAAAGEFEEAGNWSGWYHDRDYPDPDWEIVSYKIKVNA